MTRSPVALDYTLQPLIGHKDLHEIKCKIKACLSFVVLVTEQWLLEYVFIIRKTRSDNIVALCMYN